MLTHLAEKVLPDSGLDFAAFRQHRNIRAAIAATVPGMAQLADIDDSKREFHIAGRLKHQPTFKTPDGRANFVTHAFTQDAADKAFPYKLMTVRSEGQFNTIIYEEKDSYRSTDDRWSIMLGAADIQRLGIESESRVTLRSRHGGMVHLKVFAFDLPQGNVMAYFPEANVLVGRERDPRSQTPAFKSIDIDLQVERAAS